MSNERLSMSFLPNPNDEFEKRILRIWKECFPSKAFRDGLDGCAGKLFISTSDNIHRVLSTLTQIRKYAKDERQKKLIQCLETTMRFEEPHITPSNALWAYFRTLVKGGINSNLLLSLTDHTDKAMKASMDRLSLKKWPVEIKIITCNACKSLLAIIKIIEEKTADKQLINALQDLQEKVESYRQAFDVEGVDEGDFSEIYPILIAKGGDIGRSDIYPKILRDMFDFPELPSEIETRSLKWFNRELPMLRNGVHKLAAIYGVQSDVETVTKEMEKRRKVENPIQFMEDIRETIDEVVKQTLVDITPNFDIRIIETPSYFTSFISTAAMSPFNLLTNRPYNIAFITTDIKRAPSLSSPELLQTLVHEVYGHCVNFSNSATRFAANPTLTEMLDSALHYPISEGISFHREYEFLKILKKIIREGKFKQFLQNMDRIVGDLDTFVLEVEFVVWKWRIIRFLRAVGDVRINMGKQKIVEFLRWAHKETGLSEKMVFDQIFMLMDTPGYAPVYCIAGESLRCIQELAVQKEENLRDFNTYASSLGFPARTIFEKRLKEYAGFHTEA